MNKYFLTILTLSVIPLRGDTGIEEQYTTMRPIAGRAQSEDGNFWLEIYEGADPNSVELSNPHHCGTDALGRVYIVDKESHSILRISADGSKITTVAGTHLAGNGSDTATPATAIALSNPNGLFVFADGGFLILDTDNRKIRKVDSQGMGHTLIHYNSNAIENFGAGRGLVATPDGESVYFCGEYSGAFQLVKKWTASDGQVTTFASDTPHGGRGLGNLALAPDGSLIVTSVGAHRVYRTSESNDTEIIAGNGLEDGNIVSGSLATEVSLNRVRGVAVREDGSYFLATQKGGDIWWVDHLTKRIHLFVNGASSGNNTPTDGMDRLGPTDRIAEPRAIHLAGNGDLLITSNDTGIISAVRSICPIPSPEPALKGSNLTWEAAWGQTVLIESAEDPNALWSPLGGASSTSAGLQSFEILLSPGKRFFRLQSPQLAAGN